MGFPFQINPASPIETDSASSGDDELRALKQIFVDLFGIPPTTNITAAIMDVAADGTITTPGLVRLGTITDQKAILDGTATWNDAADTFTAILASITDTASAAASKLIDLKVGGTTKISGTKAGVLYAAGGYQQPGTNGETLKKIRGEVSSAGAVVRGAGFTVSRLSAGTYQITFSTGFSAPPTVVANAANGNARFMSPNPDVTLPNSVAIVRAYNLSGVLADVDFTFTADGPV